DRGFNVCAEIPRAFFGLEKRVDDALAQARKIGINHVYCGNIGAAALAKNHGFSIHGGFGLNVFNSQAVDFYKSLGLCDTELSFELCAKQINNISSDIGIGIVGYGYLPLMITRNCPNKNGNGCKSCGEKSVITDRLGNNFTLMCQSGCTEMLNCKPLIISDKLSQFETIDFVTLRFTFESAHECERIFNNYLHKNKPHSEYTGGLYFRGVE
ncbi:MAG: U32 family peptidase, partial [Clostridia bacterium]|nr:U32 family peptidase [Clostridia bacterium]